MEKEDFKEYFYSHQLTKNPPKVEISHGLLIDNNTFSHNTITNIAGYDFIVKISPINKDYEHTIKIIEELCDDISHFMGNNNSDYEFDVKIELNFKKKIVLNKPKI